MTDSIKINGIPEVSRALYKFNAELAIRVQRTALRNGANHMKAHIKAVTPVAKKTGKNTEPGLAKRTLKVYNSKRHSAKKDGIISVWVGWPRSTGGRFLKGKAGKKTAYYIGWVEHGYNRGSERAGVGLSESLGLVANGTASARKLLGRKNRGRGIRQGRLFTRFGGKRVEGQHFVERAFDTSATGSLAIIVNSSNTIISHLAKELGFKVGSS
jgi:hypothetical protein